jgi:hypothetical protein
LLHFQCAVVTTGSAGVGGGIEADLVDAAEAKVVSKVEDENADADVDEDEDEDTASGGSRRPTARGGGGGWAITVGAAAKARGAVMTGARNELDAAMAAPAGAAVRGRPGAANEVGARSGGARKWCAACSCVW